MYHIPKKENKQNLVISILMDFQFSKLSATAAHVTEFQPNGLECLYFILN